MKGEGRQGPLGTYYGVLFEVALEGVTTQQLVHSRVSQRAHLTCFLCQGILPLNLPPFFDSIVCPCAIYNYYRMSGSNGWVIFVTI